VAGVVRGDPGADGDVPVAVFPDLRMTFGEFVE